VVTDAAEAGADDGMKVMDGPGARTFILPCDAGIRQGRIAPDGTKSGSGSARAMAVSTNPDLIREFTDRCQQTIREFEEIQVRCGLIGPSGSGKSSLVNAIAGEKIAAVGVVETTTDPQEFMHKGITFVDLPGCGTQKWPRETYIERLGLDRFDCFLLVTAHRFYESDAFLYRELTARGKPCFVVRNMIDRAIEDGLHDNSHSPEETRALITADIRRQLEPSPPPRVYLTSARQPTQHDLRALLEAISQALEGLKRSRFVADMAAYGEQALERKRQVANERIVPYAGLAAANGLNPIPGLDIGADISLLIKLGNEIAGIYGLTDRQLAYVRRLLGPDALPGLMAKAAQFAGKYLAREGVMALLRQLARNLATKEVSRFIPFVGPLVAAGIGWQATFLLGEQLVREAEGLAEEVLHGIVQGAGEPG